MAYDRLLSIVVVTGQPPAELLHYKKSIRQFHWKNKEWSNSVYVTVHRYVNCNVFISIDRKQELCYILEVMRIDALDIFKEVVTWYC